MVRPNIDDMRVVIRNQHISCIQRVIEAKLDLNLIIDNKTVLSLALEDNRNIFVKIIIDAKADVNLANDNYYNPLIVAARNKNVEGVRMLINARANVHIQDRKGHTALLEAASNGLHICVNALLKEGANINHINLNRQSPLHVAAMNGSLESVKLLIENKANIDGIDNPGKTPLVWAIFYHHYECTELLLKSNANIEIDEGSPLHYAVRNEDINIINLLVDYKANVNSAMVPLQTGNVSTSKILLEAKADITKVDLGSVYSIDVMRLLLENKADVNSVDKRHIHASALLWACMDVYVNVEKAKLLIEWKANVCKGDKYGTTPLMMALLGSILSDVLNNRIKYIIPLLLDELMYDDDELDRLKIMLPKILKHPKRYGG